MLPQQQQQQQQQHTAQHQQFAQPPQSQERQPQYMQPKQPALSQPQYMQPQAPQFYNMPAAGGGAFSPASGGGVNDSAGQPSHDMFADASAPSSAQLGAESYEPIFEDTPVTTQPKQQNQRGNRASEADDDDDYMGLYNKPKKPVLPPVEQARGGDDSSVSSLFATSASSLRQRRGGSASEDSQPSSSSFSSSPGSQPAARAAAPRRRSSVIGSRPATRWHWPWVSRLAGLVLLAYFISLGYRHVEKVHITVQACHVVCVCAPALIRSCATLFPSRTDLRGLWISCSRCRSSSWQQLLECLHSLPHSSVSVSLPSC
jgi:hypothetical protein